MSLEGFKGFCKNTEEKISRIFRSKGKCLPHGIARSVGKAVNLLFPSYFQKGMLNNI